MSTRSSGSEAVPESLHDGASFGATLDVRETPGARQSVVTLDDPLAPARAVLRRWRLVLLFAMVGGALGWLSAIVATEADTAPIEVDHFQARHVLVLDSNIPETTATLGVRNLNVLAKRVTIGAVPEAVAEQTGLSRTEAASQVRVLIRSDSESLDLVTIGRTPGVAETLADAYAVELLAFLNDEAERYAVEAEESALTRLQEAEQSIMTARSELAAAERAADERTIANIEQDLQQLESARIYANAQLLEVRADGVPTVPIETLQFASGSASVISQSRFNELVDNASIGQNIEVLFRDEAESESSVRGLAAVSSRLPDGVLPRLIIGFLVGLLGGLIAAAVLNRLDNRVRSKRQVEALLDLPVIAEVPALNRQQRRTAEVHSKARPRSRFAEQYRGLASVLAYARRARSSRGQVVLVTSPGPSEGKTTTVANLGAMLAEAGESVLLINCDFRRPRLHVLTGSDYQPMDLNRTQIPEVELISNVVDDTDALPTEVIAAQRSVIKKAAKLYDLIIIDTAPLLATNDAVDLLDLVDDVVLVLRAGKTTMQAADRGAEVLDRRNAHVLGVVITDVDARNSTDYYYYYDGYYDESPAKQDRARFGRRGRKADIDLVDSDEHLAVPSSKVS